MSKREKLKFEDLEKLDQGGKLMFSNGELLEILTNKEKAEKALQTRKLEFFATLFRNMAASPEFRGKVLEIITRRRIGNDGQH